jgi:ABC-type cobalamin transport system ATPase subunit
MAAGFLAQRPGCRERSKALFRHEGKVLACVSKTEVLTRENIKTAFRLEPTLVRTDQTSMYLVFD